MKHYLLRTTQSALLLGMSFILLLLSINALAQNVQQDWARQYDTQKAQFDFQTGNKLITLDAEGNSYVTLNSNTVDSKVKITTIKYSANGEQLWAKEYKDTANRDVTATAIMVDNSGSIYITGYKQKENSAGYISNDYLTISYNTSDGSQRWVSTYTGSSDDEALAIAVDNAGSVFVTGRSWGGASHEDYATVRYNALDGKEIWVRTYAGIWSDEATAIAVDKTGSVYVTGTVMGTAGNSISNYATIRYNVSDGQAVWVSSFDGEKRQGAYAKAIAVDNTGSVYVTGKSYNGASTDYATLRYNATDGSQIWMKTYNGTGNDDDDPTDIAVDNTGGVYVTGYSKSIASGENYATVRYNTSTGTQDWVSIFNGEGNKNDRPFAIAVDYAGSVYVTGVSYGGESTGDNYTTLRYNTADGQQVWAQAYNGSENGNDVATSIAVSKNGGVHVTGTTIDSVNDQDIATIRYNSINGNQTWAQTFTSTGSINNIAADIVVDAEGNSYVTGTNSGLNSSIVTIKYSPSGEELWIKTFEDDVYRSTAGAIILDNEGGLYVTGGGSGGVIVIRYNTSDGSQVWASTSNIPGRAEDIVADNAGGLYVTGSSNNGAIAGNDYLTIRFDATTGEQTWTRFYNTGSLYDKATQVLVDGQGSVYVTGQSTKPKTPEFENHTVVKYDATTGEQLWAYSSDTDLTRVSTAIDLDNDGNIYVTGYSTKMGTTDFVTERLNPTDGSQVWESIYKTGGQAINPIYIAIDTTGGVYVSGRGYNPSAPGYNFTTIRYDAATGNQGWVSYFSINAGSSDRVRAISVDNAGGVYVAGTSYSGATGSVITTVKYAAENGNLIWNINSKGPNDGVGAINLDAKGNIFVTGTTSSLATGQDILTIKYSQGIPCDMPVTVSLSLPQYAMAAGEQVRTTANFKDYVLGDDHSIRWEWGDGSASSVAYKDAGDTHITGQHRYTEAGIYKIGLDFSQSCLQEANHDYDEWAVIYDPSGGNVTGSGSFISPLTNLHFMNYEGPTDFSFKVSYTAGSTTVPEGYFQVELGNRGTFRTSSFEWLVISGSQAVWKGEGTLEGKGNYGFIVSASDAGGTGADDLGDKIRIRIWDKDLGNAIHYDNFSQAGDIYDMTTELQAIATGQIIINSTPTIAQAATQQAELYNYPNTFTDKTTINFTLPTSGEYTLEVYDMRGKLVKHVATGRAEAKQNYSYELNGASLRKGLYVARLVTASGTQSIKMLLQR